MFSLSIVSKYPGMTRIALEFNPMPHAPEVSADVPEFSQILAGVTMIASVVPRKL